MFSVYGGDRYITTSLTGLPENLQHRVAASFVRDSKTGKSYLKLANALPVELTINLAGLTLPEGAKAEGFNGQPEEQNVEIKSEEVKGNKLILPPYAFKVIAL